MVKLRLKPRLVALRQSTPIIPILSIPVQPRPFEAPDATTTHPILPIFPNPSHPSSQQRTPSFPSFPILNILVLNCLQEIH